MSEANYWERYVHFIVYVERGLIHCSYGSYTLHGTGTEMGTIENNGSLSLCSVSST